MRSCFMFAMYVDGFFAVGMLAWLLNYYALLMGYVSIVLLVLMLLLHWVCACRYLVYIRLRFLKFNNEGKYQLCALLMHRFCWFMMLKLTILCEMMQETVEWLLLFFFLALLLSLIVHVNLCGLQYDSILHVDANGTWLYTFNIIVVGVMGPLIL